MVAVSIYDMELLQLLLHKGANPNHKANRELFKRIMDKDRSDILLLLIKEGWKFDPNQPRGSLIYETYQPSLPLIEAIETDSIRIVEALLTLGADPYLAPNKNPKCQAMANKTWQPDTHNAFDHCKDPKTNERVAIKKLLDQYQHDKVQRSL